MVPLHDRAGGGLTSHPACRPRYHEGTPSSRFDRSGRMSAPTPHPHRILLADCDAMFVSVARLVDPQGAGRSRLLLVGGSPEGRGVVASASYAARRYGVRSGMAMAHAVHLCPRAMVVGVPREEVGRISREIQQILAEYAAVLEPASVDEFYLDMSGTERAVGGDLGALATLIRRRVLGETRISLSIGGGTNKLIAKLAATRAKPAGVHVVPPGREEEFMRGFRLADIPGVGPVAAERYARFELVSVSDALRQPREALVGWFGEREGDWLYQRIRGIHHGTVEPPGPSKSHSREETFATDLHDDRDLTRELTRLATRVGRDLRADGRLARTLTVKIRDRDFRTRQASRTLKAPFDSDRAILDLAASLLARLRRERRVGARLVGVTLSNLTRAADSPHRAQLGLFEDEAHTASDERERRLSETMDALAARFGSRTVQRGSLFGDERDE